MGDHGGDLFHSLIPAMPQAGPIVDVKGDQRTGLAGHGCRFEGGAAAGLLGQTQRPEMKGTCLLQQRAVQFIRPQLGVGAGVAIEDELGRVLIRFGDEGHGRACIGVEPHAARFHPLRFQHVGQVMAKGILAHLADKGGIRSQAGGGHGNVSRCAAWLGMKGGYLCHSPSQLGWEHVNQKLTQ